MLLFLIAAVLTGFGIVALSLSDGEEIMVAAGLLVLFIGGFGLLVLCSIAITGHSNIDNKIHYADMRYKEIVKQLEASDDDESFSKTEIAQKVHNWNASVYKSKCYADSPWTNCLFSKEYADSLKYIEMEE